MNLIGSGFKKKPNLLGEVVERRKNEGDFTGFRMSFGRPGGPFSWAQENAQLVFVCLTALVVAAVIAWLVLGKGFFRDATKPTQDASLPRPKGSAAPAAKPEPKGYINPQDGKFKAFEKPAAAAAAPAAADSPAKEAPPPAPPPAEAGEAGPSAAEGPTAFRPMEPRFKALDKIDPAAFEGVWDHDAILNDPQLANNIKEPGEAAAVFELFRFLRSQTPEELAAKVDNSVSHDDLLRTPDAYRGRVLSVRLQLKRKGMVYGWPQNDSGVRDATMLYGYGLTARGGSGFFVVLAPQPPEDFQEDSEYFCTAVFLKRYPYLCQDDVWRWQPLLLTLDLRREAVSESTSKGLIYAAGIVVAIGIVLLLLMVRGETRESQEKRRERMERRRLSRERFNQPPPPPPPPPPSPPAPPTGGP